MQNLKKSIKLTNDKMINLSDLTGVLENVNENLDIFLKSSLVFKVLNIVKSNFEKSNSILISKNADYFASSLDLDYLLNCSYSDKDEIILFANNLSEFLIVYINEISNTLKTTDKHSIANLIKKVGFNFGG